MCDWGEWWEADTRDNGGWEGPGSHGNNEWEVFATGGSSSEWGYLDSRITDRILLNISI